MSTDSRLRQGSTCTIEGYAKAWCLGTGLPIGLAPGQYQITGQDCVNGTVYFRLDNAYRIEARKLAE